MAIRISVVIPTYHEGELGKCISYLKQQTAWQKGIMEIVIADHFETGLTYPNPTFVSLVSMQNRDKITVVSVDKRGIAYARHMGIMASKGDIIVNFDADCYFDKIAAIELLAEPVMRKVAQIVCCEQIHDTSKLTPEQIQSISLVNSVHSYLNGLQKNPFFPPCLESGMTFSKEAYTFVGGFSDVPQYEGFLLASKIMHAYTPQMKYFEPDVKVVASPRRALGAAAEGLGKAYVGYQTHYR